MESHEVQAHAGLPCHKKHISLRETCQQGHPTLFPGLSVQARKTVLVLRQGGRNPRYGFPERLRGLEDIRQNGIDIEALAAKAKPSDADWTALENLRRTLPESEVVTCKYLPLTGIVERTDGQGRKTVYTYDCFNRLERELEVKDGRMIPVRQYEYHLETERQGQP